MSSDVIIVEFLVPASQAVRLQSILQGEDGLATIRCFDPEKRRQQFWTTPEQLSDLYAWIESLPDTFGVEITGEWRWRSDAVTDVQGAVE
ncbi:MAG: DUF4911 domain-containing protein [Mariprofundaceae bacterium]